VKREIVRQSGGIAVRMSVLCFGTKIACDDLVKTFQKLNDQVKANMQGKK
jgi:hypothetical protein